MRSKKKKKQVLVVGKAESEMWPIDCRPRFCKTGCEVEVWPAEWSTRMSSPLAMNVGTHGSSRKENVCPLWNSGWGGAVKEEAYASQCPMAMIKHWGE